MKCEGSFGTIGLGLGSSLRLLGSLSGRAGCLLSWCRGACSLQFAVYTRPNVQPQYERDGSTGEQELALEQENGKGEDEGPVGVAVGVALSPGQVSTR